MAGHQEKGICPLFGKFPDRDWILYHSWHCALHLSFVQTDE